MRCLIALGLAVLAPVFARAAGPTCALLDPEKSPRAALLEAKLLADPSATWVERADIDKVLKEQKLQALFSAQGVGDRVKLGKLLKAEVLVMVRPVKAGSEPALEVVIGETAGGLRLLVRAVPITADVEADLVAVQSAVKEGLRKYAEAVKEVVAVPPLLSNDLEFTHDYLRGAFAKLMESEALGRPGVVVVELAEAEALAKEFALTAPGSRLDRPLPLYLLGEFRNEGKGAERTITLKLRAERGGKAEGTPLALALKGDEAPATVRKWAAGVLDALAKDATPRPPADPKAETKVLNERALENARLGNWQTALELLESSLLLDPLQLDCRAEAIHVIWRIEKSIFQIKPGSIDWSYVRCRAYLRRLNHIEAFVDYGGRFRVFALKYGENLPTVPDRNFGYWLSGYRPPDLLALHDEAKREDYRVIMKIRTVAIQQYNAEMANPKIGLIYRTKSDRSDISFLRHTDRQMQEPNKGLIALPPGLPPSVSPKASAPFTRPDPSANRIKFAPIELNIPPDSVIGAKPRPFHPVGLAAVGPDVDLLWDSGNLYFMRSKGKLELLRVSYAGNGARTYAVRYDGRYAWITWHGWGHPANLYVFDPLEGKIREVTPAEGLPEVPKKVESKSSIRVCPVGPGRVCISGSYQRSWIGMATFDSTTKRTKVEVFHEAREANSSVDRNQWASTTVAFAPTHMYAIRDKAGPDGARATRVILIRDHTDSLHMGSVPLIIDPEKRSVEIANFFLPENSRHAEYVEAGDTFYSYHYGTAYNHKLRVLRFYFPGRMPEVAVDEMPFSPWMTCREGETFHMLEAKSGFFDSTGTLMHHDTAATFHLNENFYYWHTWKEGTNRPQLVGVDIPRVTLIAVSNHYGLVAALSPRKKDPPDPSLLHSVTFDPPPPKK